MYYLSKNVTKTKFKFYKTIDNFKNELPTSYKMERVRVTRKLINSNSFQPAGELNVNLINDKGVEVPLQVNDNEDGSFLIDYVPTSSGVHSLNCTYGGVKVPNTPVNFNVQSLVDVSKVKVDGLETRK